MTKPNPFLYYPPCVFDYADDQERAELLANNQAHIDVEAANIVDAVCEHHRDDWADPRVAIKLRFMLRTVANHLRDRADGR